MIRILRVSLFFLASSFCSADDGLLSTKFSWAELNNLPRDIAFEGEVAGYLSIFRLNDSWHIYLYEDRESLIEHNELHFMKIDEVSFGNFFNLEGFLGNEKLLKSLDQRFIRISGKFKRSESSVAEVPFYIDVINSLRWRGAGGKWTSNINDGLNESPLREGRELMFPDAVFFEHNQKGTDKLSPPSDNNPLEIKPK